MQRITEGCSVERVIFVTTLTSGYHVLLITGPRTRLKINDHTSASTITIITVVNLLFRSSQTQRYRLTSPRVRHSQEPPFRMALLNLTLTLLTLMVDLQNGVIKNPKRQIDG